MDFAKAFDSVWHSALLSKLLSLDLPLCFVEWIRSYLSDRCSKVRICNSCSRLFRLRRGVFQGSVLGPVLFFLYINDLPIFLPTSVKTSLYADDLAIKASSPSVECATSTVQAALNRLVVLNRMAALNKIDRIVALNRMVLKVAPPSLPPEM